MNLPKWEHWGLSEDLPDETLGNVETALDQGVIIALTVGRQTARGYQVSVRRDGVDGWEVYYGFDLAETIARAVMAGPQLPTKKVEPLAPWNDPKVLTIIAQAELEGWAREDNGVEYAFNSEGITPI